MVNSFVAKKDLDTEMTVVRNEFESGENNPGSSARRAHDVHGLSVAQLWQFHHWLRAPTIENVPIERLQGFYKTYYQPDNAVLLVAGKFDERKNARP